MKRFSSENRIQYLGFNDLKFMVLGIIALSLFLPISFFNVSGEDIVHAYLNKAFMSFVHVIVYWVIIRFFLLKIRKWNPDFDYTRRRIFYAIVFIIPLGVIMGPLINIFLDDFCAMELDQGHDTIKGLSATYFCSFLILSIYEAVYLYAQNQSNIIKGEKLKRDHIRSELEGLRNQINPHFLFNTLNTLTNVIEEDQKLATSFTQELSYVYRYILEKKDDHLILLKEELNFIESYLFLQKERYQDALKVVIHVAEEYQSYFVVPLSLQILFENAIKHNVISQKNPLLIEVYVEHDFLVIRNNLQLRKDKMPSTGLGLKNIESRYTYFTKQAMSYEAQHGFFVVKIPLLKNYKDTLS